MRSPLGPGGRTPPAGGGQPPPAGSSLRRPRDHVERALSLLLLAVTLVAAPIAATAVGTDHHAREVAEARDAAVSNHRSAAVLMEDAPALGDANGPGGGTRVPVRAVVGDSTARPRTITVWIEGGRSEGERVTVWLDPSGRPVEPPPGPAEVATRAWMAGLGVLALCGMTAAALLRLLRHTMVRAALPAWEREWRRVGPGWSR